ncbi:MAG: hypothetical protein K2H47_01860 [Muribaculaceae bacterium]|nr:hypothetical protein [Muribaculaceae bacterium]
MNKEITNQQLGLLGENLVCANLLAHGWDVANLNVSFGNFRNIDLICQNSENKSVTIQIKTMYKNPSAFIGITSYEAAACKDNDKLVSAWVFVKINTLIPLQVDYYILSRNQMIELTSKLHHWYLFEWNRPVSQSLKDSPANMSIWMLQGRNRQSKYADKEFVNPFNSTSFLNKWDNIWLP